MQYGQGFWNIIIRKDKTLVCAFEDNFKQNGVKFYRPSASEHGQNITNITMIRKQLCDFIDMYIGKIVWPTAPCQGYPEKEIINKLGTGVVFGSFFDSTQLKSFHSLLNSNVTLLTSSNGDWRETSFVVVCAAFQCLFL